MRLARRWEMPFRHWRRKGSAALVFPASLGQPVFCKVKQNTHTNSQKKKEPPCKKLRLSTRAPSTASPGKSQTVTWHPVSRLDILLARGLFFWSSLSESLIARDAPGLPCMWQNCCKGIMIRGPHKCWLLPICAQGGSPQSNNTHAKRQDTWILYLSRKRT